MPSSASLRWRPTPRSDWRRCKSRPGPWESTIAPPILVRTRPLIDRQIVNVDLIPHALREDQRRLPPSLTDRFALQVTPPTFFTFALPEPTVTLGRYQHADFPIRATVQPGVDAKIEFSAKGGQIAPKEEGRTRVYAEFADGKGTIHSKILTNLTKHRVEVTGVGVKDGRRVALTRTFDLDIRAAFTVTPEPALLKLEPGGSGMVRLNVQRLPSFDGAIAVQLSPALGIELPATVTIPRGQSGVDVPVKIAPGRAAGRQSVQMNLSARSTASRKNSAADSRSRFSRRRRNSEPLAWAPCGFESMRKASAVGCVKRNRADAPIPRGTGASARLRLTHPTADFEPMHGFHPIRCRCCRRCGRRGGRS